jgi:hypothetical protein
MKMTRAKLLVMVAFSIPIAIELRVLFGFFGIDLPLLAVVVFEAVFLVLIAIAYMISAEPKSATNH